MTPGQSLWVRARGKVAPKQTPPVPDPRSNRDNSLLSLDVFDTLLRRKVHPDAVKVFSWQRVLLLTSAPWAVSEPRLILEARNRAEAVVARKLEKEGFDPEYELSSVLLDYGFDIGAIEDQYKFELKVEKSFIYQDPSIRRFIQKFSPDRLKILSDFYMSSDRLRELITDHFPEFADAELLVSCELNLSKRSGRAYAAAGGAPSWTHIGDNPWSDGEMALQHGINAVIFQPFRESQKVNQRAKLWHRRLDGEYHPGRRLSSAMKIAVGLLGYLAWLTSHAQHRGARIVFLEREGVVLFEAYQLFQKYDPWVLPRVEHSILPISRISASKAAAAAHPESFLGRFFWQYPEAGVRELCKTLNLTTKLFPVRMQKLVGRELLRNIIQSDSLLTKIQKTLRPDLRLFQEFVSQQIPGVRNLVFADIGWSGTIQKSFSEGLGEETTVVGRYLALHNMPHKNLDIDGFVDSSLGWPHNVIMRAPRPLEMLFNPPLNSVLGYRGEDNSVRPVRSNVLDGQPPSFVRFRRKILDSFPPAARFISEEALTVAECRVMLAEGLSEFIRFPSRAMCEEFLNENHDETYGLGKIVDLGSIRAPSPLALIVAFFLHGRDHALALLSNHSGWAEASFWRTIRIMPTVWVRKSVGVLSIFLSKQKG